MEDCFELKAPLAEVDAFLAKYGMLDSTMGEFERRKRYSRFSTVTFDLLPEERWAACFRQLLEFEPMLAGSQFDIGRVDAHPFTIDYQGEPDLSTRPIYYPPEQRQWVKW